MSSFLFHGEWPQALCLYIVAVKDRRRSNVGRPTLWDIPCELKISRFQVPCNHVTVALTGLYWPIFSGGPKHALYVCWANYIATGYRRLGIPQMVVIFKAGIPTKCPTSSTLEEMWSRRAASLSHIYGCCFEMVGNWAWKKQRPNTEHIDVFFNLDDE